MKVLLFANGLITEGSVVQSQLAAADGQHIVCADGGALHARAHGLSPHTIIGDMDSLSPEHVAEFQAAGSQIIRYPAEKDASDLELALLHCRDIGAKSLSILGALGGRFDQTLANLLLLTLPDLRDMSIAIIDGEQTIGLLRPGAHDIIGQPGDTVSLIPLSASVDGIRTRGLKFPLNDESLIAGPARGISNVMLSDRAGLSFRQGTLLLAHTVGRA